MLTLPGLVLASAINSGTVVAETALIVSATFAISAKICSTSKKVSANKDLSDAEDGGARRSV
jgi:hypothetical protein